MRRAVMIVTALIGIGAATAAYAATQPYTGSVTFAAKHVGTRSRPVPLKFTLSVKTTAPSSTRPPVQLDIKLRVYGMKVDGKDFPTCSAAKIAAAHNDTICPPGARLATGYIHSVLGSATDFSKAGAACDPALDVWNSGQGKQTYFFVTNTTTHACLGGALKTGSTPPYPGTYKQRGNYFTSDVTVPKYIDYPLAGLVGSLQYEHLVFTSQTRKVGGKTLISQASTGCRNGKRPYSITTTTTGGSVGAQHQVSTISGSAGC
ncbi:MAG: hypothetical protein ACR2NR_11405 [Solirubrobacteraceae bacterium]